MDPRYEIQSIAVHKRFLHNRRADAASRLDRLSGFVQPLTEYLLIPDLAKAIAYESSAVIHMVHDRSQFQAKGHQQPVWMELRGDARPAIIWELDDENEDETSG